MVAIVPDREQFAAEMQAGLQCEFSDLVRHGQRLRDVAQSCDLGRRRDAGIHDQNRPSCFRNIRATTCWMLPIPATFVVGKDGRIKARFVDPDYRKRMTIEDLIGALK